MDFTLSDEILAKKAAARRWVEEVLDPLSEPLETEERLPDELVAALKAGEFFGLTIPKEYGGQGWSAVEWFSVLEELSRGYAMVRMIGHTMNGLFWRPIEAFGTEEQKRRYLPPLASGELWAANSLTEPEGGTGKDLNAKCVRDGDHYVLNGHKWLITQFPGYTKLFYAFAVSEDEGPICFLVDAPCEGLDLVPMERMMGCSGPRHYHVYYNDLRVPEANILGEKGKGLDVAFGMLHLSRTSIAIGCVGLAQKMLDLAVAYAKAAHDLRQEALQPPGHPAQPGPDGHRDRGRPPVGLPSGLALRQRHGHRHRGGHGQALRRAGGHPGGRDGAAGARWYRLHQGVSAGAALPRRPQLPLRGGDRGDPEAAHRPARVGR